MKRLLLIALTLVTAFNLIGCETMEGFGRDVEKAGDNIEDAAK